MSRLTQEQAIRAYDYLNTTSLVVDKHNDGKDWITITSETTEELARDWLIAEGISFVARGVTLPLTAFFEVFFGGGEMGTSIPREELPQEFRDQTRPFTMEGNRLLPNLFPEGRSGLVDRLTQTKLEKENVAKASVKLGFENFYLKGHYKQALALYDQAIALSPHMKSFYFNCAQANVALGNYQQALNDLKTCQQDLSFNQTTINDYQNVIIQSIANYEISKGALRLGYEDFLYQRYDRAIALYSQAISLNPADKSIYHYRALVYTALGNYDQATSDNNASQSSANFDQNALKLYNDIQVKMSNEQRAREHIILGLNLSSTQNPQMAIAQYDAASTLDPALSKEICQHREKEQNAIDVKNQTNAILNSTAASQKFFKPSKPGIQNNIGRVNPASRGENMAVKNASNSERKDAKKVAKAERRHAEWLEDMSYGRDDTVEERNESVSTDRSTGGFFSRPTITTSPLSPLPNIPSSFYNATHYNADSTNGVGGYGTPTCG
jgi:tetratricopeptide (TPR) repeat protein